MAALRETHKSALLAHAEAREKTLAGIAAVERRLAKVELQRGAGRGRGGLSPSFHAPRAQAKRCIESDRPVDDFSALWEQMRLAYDEAEDHATNFKRAGTVRTDGRPRSPAFSHGRSRRPVYISPAHHAAAGPQVRAEQEREYMQKQGTYLNGLQSHMLGDSEPDSLATRIFKKCAFVADTFSRNRHAAL